MTHFYVEEVGVWLGGVGIMLEKGEKSKCEKEFMKSYEYLWAVHSSICSFTNNYWEPPKSWGPWEDLII